MIQKMPSFCDRIWHLSSACPPYRKSAALPPGQQEAQRQMPPGMHHAEAIVNLFRGVSELLQQSAFYLFELAPERPEECRIFGTAEQGVAKRHRRQGASIQHRRVFVIEREYQSNGTWSYMPCSNSVRDRSSRVLRRAE